MGKKISILVGSLRKESFNRKIANELIRLAPNSLTMEIVEIGDLPFYNEDLEGTHVPVSWSDFRNQIKDSDGVLFVTPEYNRSISGVLKNAIDVGSRPYIKNTWQGKAGAVISVSPGSLGAFGANHIVRQSMVCLNVYMMQQPEGYVNYVGSWFDENGKLIAGKEKFLTDYINAYAQWVDRLSN